MTGLASEGGTSTCDSAMTGSDTGGGTGTGASGMTGWDAEDRTGARVMSGFDAVARSEGDLIGVPQWLQNVDLKGTRFPQREQNEPVGRDDVSFGMGATGVFSVILPNGRAVSIFFFAGRVVVAPPFAGTGTSFFVTGSSSDGAIFAGGVSPPSGEGIRLLSFFAHSIHSRFLSPPDCLTKVRTVWCLSPEPVVMVRIKKWSRIAFSPASTFLIVERAIS